MDMVACVRAATSDSPITCPTKQGLTRFWVKEFQCIKRCLFGCLLLVSVRLLRLWLQSTQHELFGCIFLHKSYFEIWLIYAFGG